MSICSVNALRALFLSVLFLISLQPLEAQDTIKVVEYNLLNYGVSGFGCTPVSTKDGYLTTIMTQIKPDILGVNELSATTSAYAERILTQVMQPIDGNYKRATLTNNANRDITNMLFYNSAKLTLHDEKVINHTLRDINYYSLYYNSADLATNADTVFIHIVVVHLKAGSATSDQSVRANQTQVIMAFLNALGIKDNLIILGDFNLKSSSETSYQNLITHSNLDIKMYDPVNSPGNWNFNAVFTCLHTQSTASSGVGCGAGGGLDDRFDFIMINEALKNNTYDAQYLPGSYKAYGNDCNHFNDPINNPTNTAVSSGVANALKAFSDHLPTMMNVKINRAPAVGVDEPRAFLAGIEIDLLGNPVSEMLAFRVWNQNSQSENLRFEVLDLNGKTLLSYSADMQTGKSRHEIEAVSLAAGMYLFRVEDGKGNFAVKKLIKR